MTTAGKRRCLLESDGWCLLAVRATAAEKQVQRTFEQLCGEQGGEGESLGRSLLKHVNDAAAELRIALRGSDGAEVESDHNQDREMGVSAAAAAARDAVDMAGSESAAAVMLRAVVLDAVHVVVEKIRVCSLSAAGEK
jgi:hypothetical protein